MNEQQKELIERAQRAFLTALDIGVNENELMAVLSKTWLLRSEYKNIEYRNGSIYCDGRHVGSYDSFEGL